MPESYEDVLSLTRAWIDDTQVSTNPERLLEDLQARERGIAQRRIGAGMLAALVVAAFLASIFLRPFAQWTCDWVTPGAVVRYGIVHTLGFVVGAALVGVQRTWAQILVRSLWWSGLLAASVGLWTELGTLPLLMPVLIVASVVGLWSLEGEVFAADVHDGGLALVRHRALVVAMLVFAIADVENLLVSALNHEEPGTAIYALSDLAGALPLLVGVIGLYRLRTWGYLVVVGSNVLILGLAIAGVLTYDPGFRLLLAITASVQIGLGIPLARAMLGREPLVQRRLPVSGVALGRAVLVLALLLGAVGAWRAAQPAQLAAHCDET